MLLQRSRVRRTPIHLPGTFSTRLASAGRGEIEKQGYPNPAFSVPASLLGPGNKFPVSAAFRRKRFAQDATPPSSLPRLEDACFFLPGTSNTRLALRGASAIQSSKVFESIAPPGSRSRRETELKQLEKGEAPIDRISSLSLALPEAYEEPFGGHSAPAFRVNKKLFAMTSEDGTRLELKAAPGVQQALIGSNPECFYVPKYIGHAGWVGVQLQFVSDWEEIAELIEESYRLIAPKRCVKLLDGKPC